MHCLMPQRDVNSPHVAHAIRTTIPFEEGSMNAKDICRSQVLALHFASALYSSSCSAMLSCNA